MKPSSDSRNENGTLNARPKAVVVGPGKIGCGFVGQLLHASGFDLVFVSRNPVLVDHINRVGCYKVRLESRNGPEETLVDGIRAVGLSEPERVAAEIASSDLVATSVGCDNLCAVAPVIAAGLALRKSPVNVLAFENMGNTKSCLCEFAGKCLGPGCPVTRFDFAAVVLTRVVSRRIGDPAKDEPLVFVGDSPETFFVDGTKLRAPLPNIRGMRLTDEIQAWMDRKLFTFSAGHATAAYLGDLKGYHYIHTAVRDPEIRESVLSAMREGQKGLEARYGKDVAGTENDLIEIVGRFENAALCDPIDRVGRDPVRKLGSHDRLVGSAKLAEKAGVHPDKLILAMAAAMHFCGKAAEASALEMKRAINAAGPGEVLRKISKLDPDRDISRSVVGTWARLDEGGRSGRPLLSLNQFMWA